MKEREWLTGRPLFINPKTLALARGWRRMHRHGIDVLAESSDGVEAGEGSIEGDGEDLARIHSLPGVYGGFRGYGYGFLLYAAGTLSAHTQGYEGVWSHEATRRPAADALWAALHARGIADMGYRETREEHEVCLGVPDDDEYGTPVDPVEICEDVVFERDQEIDVLYAKTVMDVQRTGALLYYFDEDEGEVVSACPRDLAVRAAVPPDLHREYIDLLDEAYGREAVRLFRSRNRSLVYDLAEAAGQLRLDLPEGPSVARANRARRNRERHERLRERALFDPALPPPSRRTLRIIERFEGLP